MAPVDGTINGSAGQWDRGAAMSARLNMLTDTPPCIDWNRKIQELVKLLVEALPTLLEGEKRRVIDKVIAPFFEALLKLNKLNQVPGVGLIWMLLVASGYRDCATQLWPPRISSSGEATSAASTSSAACKSEEVANVA
jgi:hypothetical protein